MAILTSSKFKYCCNDFVQQILNLLTLVWVNLNFKMMFTILIAFKIRFKLNYPGHSKWFVLHHLVNCIKITRWQKFILGYTKDYAIQFNSTFHEQQFEYALWHVQVHSRNKKPAFESFKLFLLIFQSMAIVTKWLFMDRTITLWKSLFHILLHLCTLYYITSYYIFLNMKIVFITDTMYPWIWTHIHVVHWVVYT